MSKRDYYEVLGVARNASKDEIKKAYRKIALANHPDRNPDNKEAEATFKEASVAAEILLNEEKRRAYDQFGHAGVDGQGMGGAGGFHQGDFGDLGDIFGDIFGEFFGGGGRGGRGRSRARRGGDLQVALNLTFEEAVFGCEKTIAVSRHVECGNCNGSGAKPGTGPTTCSTCSGRGEVRRQQGFFAISTTCPSCHGTGQSISDPCTKCRGEGRIRKKSDLEVKVPAGIDEGQRLKLSGEGESGQNGGPSGDLYVLINVKEHEFFERDEFDIHCVVPVSFSQVALGSEVEVPSLKGKVSVKIPAGTQSGKKMRLKGKGIPKLGGYGTGDQIIHIQVETPTKLSSKQNELFQQLADMEKGHNNPMSSNFFGRVKDLFN